MTNRKNRPTHVIFQVIGEGQGAYWNRIGSGWLNKDGKGISLRLDCVPLQGRTVVRENTPDDEAGQPTPEGADEGMGAGGQQ